MKCVDSFRHLQMVYIMTKTSRLPKSPKHLKSYIVIDATLSTGSEELDISRIFESQLSLTKIKENPFGYSLTLRIALSLLSRLSKKHSIPGTVFCICLKSAAFINKGGGAC